MDKETLITAVVAVIGGGGLTSLVMALLSKNKTNAEARKTNAETGVIKMEGELRLTHAAMEVNTQLMERMKDMEERMDKTHKRMDEQDVTIRSQADEIAELRIQIKKKDSYIETLEKKLKKR